MDFAALNDEELDALRQNVSNEQERRQRLADIPAQVAELARLYSADGGDVSELKTSLPSS